MLEKWTRDSGKGLCASTPFDSIMTATAALRVWRSGITLVCAQGDEACTSKALVTLVSLWLLRPLYTVTGKAIPAKKKRR